MKKKISFFILILFLSFYSNKIAAQCMADAGPDQTIICGGTTFLNAEPVWQALNSNTTMKLSSVCFVTSDIGYIVGENGLIIKTINGGNNWTSQSSNTTTPLNAVYFIDAQTGYAVGDGGTILKTINGGVNWTKLTSGTANNLFSVFFVNTDIGYVGGDAGLVLKTSNGGLSWNQPQIQPVTAHYPCSSLFFTSENVGYAASMMGLHPKTIDGGKTWTGTEPVGTYGGIYGGLLTSVYFLDDKTGFITEKYSSTLYKSTDGGTNWIKKTLGTDYYDINSIDFSTIDTGYVVGNGGKIFRTINKGELWTQQKTSTTNDLLSVSFPDSNTGYAVGTNGTILKMTKRNTYLWTPSTGLNNNKIANPTVTATNDITYTLTVTTPNGCISTDNVKVTVAPLTANAGADKTTVCGGTIQLTNVTTNYTGNGTLSYKWIPSTGLNNDDIPNPTATVSSDITYTVTVTSPGGCTASDNVKVTVTPLTANAGADKATVCGGTVQLNNLTTNYTGNGILSYKWTPSTGLNNDDIPNPTATVSSDITYTVTVTSPGGCTASDNIKVTVTPLTANAGADKTTVCGGTVQFNNLTTNYSGEGSLSYKWTPSTGLNNDEIPNPTAMVLNDITYTLTVTTPNGCTATDDISIKIIPMDKPEIGIVGVNNSNKNLIVWNKPVSSGIASYYIYRETNVGNVYEKIATVPYDSLSVYTDDQSFPDVKSNKYKLSVFDHNDMESALSDPHKTMHLSINKGQNNSWNLIWEPYQGFYVSTYNIYRGTNADNMSFLGATSGSSTQYTDLTAPTGDVFYQLEVVSSVVINPTKIPYSIQHSNDMKKSGEVSSTSYNSSRSNIAMYTVSAVDNLNGESKQINIYPNPVKDQLIIDFEGGSTFEILNLTGQVVYSGNLVNNTTVDTSSFALGVYVVRFKLGKTFEYSKFIKE